MKPLLAAPRILDEPTFEWLDAGARIPKQFFSFTLPTAAGFKGLASLHFDGYVLELLEQGESKAVTLLVA